MARPSRQSLKRIFLVGMPGSGKSTLGKLLALKLNLPFVDLDETIEALTKKNITDLFKIEGEDFFRQTEAETLDDLLASGGEFVMATGGGTPIYKSGMAKMLKNGRVIFLRASIETLAERVKNQVHRPLFTQSTEEKLSKTLEKMLKARIEIYETAHFQVETDDISPEVAVFATLKCCE